MKIINEIKIEESAISRIARLECVERVELWHDGTIMVFLDSKYNNGRQTASNGEYLCQFENGQWQRFGAEALNRTFKNPSREGGRQWSE